MKKYIIVITSCISLFACTKSPDKPKNDTSPVMNIAISPQVSQNTSDFAFRFFIALQQTQPDTATIFVSPLSLHMDLGMLLNGADGSTYAQLQTALALDNLSAGDINSAYQSLLKDLPNADKQVQLTLANSMWYKNNFSVLDSYTATLKSYFQAAVYASRFDAAAADSVNQWASDNTNGKIKDIISADALSPEIMLLINALYFKGEWSSQFNTKNTKGQAFSLENGNTKQVQMMSQENAFVYASKETYSAIRLPYGNGQFSMTVLLPKQGNKIADVMNDFTAADWNAFLKDTAKIKVDVGLPRFTVAKYNVDLIPTLQKMGVSDVFNADLSDLSKINSNAKLQQLYVNILKQFTYLKVDEEGSEAAAVTVTGMTSLSVQDPLPSFVCNRPFGIIISENTSDMILFMGRVMNPQSE